jgi:hypothetical protein
MNKDDIKEVFAPKKGIVKKVIKIDVSEKNYEEYKALLKEWAKERGFDIAIH